MPSTLSLRAGAVDLERGVLRRADTGYQRLTTRETALLRYLVAREGTVVPREELLVEVWGYAPSVVSRAVDKTVARLRAKLERDTRNPDHLLTEYGVGFRFVGASAPRAAPLPAPLDQLEQALSGPARLLSLVGMTGDGRSHALAALCARRPALWRASGATPAALTAAVEAAPPDAWVVIDGAEDHLDLLRARQAAWTARWRLLLSTTRPLGLQHEQLVGLPGLSKAAALALLRGVAQRRQPGWGEGEDDVLNDICDELDRWPLGLVLAGWRARLLPPAALRAHLQAGRPALLAAPGPVDLAPRHRSLQAALDHCWAGLAPAARSVLAQLAVFAAPATLAAIGAVVQPPPDTELFALLDALVVRRLVRLVPGDEPRLALFRPLRWRLAQEGRPDPALRDRHLAHFAAEGGHSVELRLGARGGPDLVTELRQELDDREAAVAHGLARQRWQEAADCGLVVAIISARSHELDRSRRVLGRLAAAEAHLPAETALELQMWRADLCFRDGAPAEGRAMMAAVHAAAQAAGLRRAQADAAFGIGLLSTCAGTGDEAGRAALAEALALRTALGLDTSVVRNQLGWLCTNSAHLPGQAAEAEAWHARALAEATQRGNQLAEGTSLLGLAELALHLDRPAEALRQATAALAPLVAMGRSAADPLEIQGRAQLALGQPEAAVALLAEACAAREAAGRYRLARSLGFLAMARLAQEGPAAAAPPLARAAALVRGQVTGTARQILLQQAIVALAEGRTEAARTARAAALATPLPALAALHRLLATVDAGLAGAS